MYGQKFLSYNIFTKGYRIEFTDPKGKSIEEVREIRNEIEKRVKELVAEIVILLLKDILDKNQ